MSFITDAAKSTTELIDTLIEEHSTQELIDILMTADDEYANSTDGDLTLTDTQYDILRRKLQLSVPHHVYFTGVGSAVRGGKVKLPHKMGSLNQIFENDVEAWVSDNRLTTSRFVITDKLDGVSAMAIYPGNDEPFQIGYSRGDGTEGADISRHLSKIVPKSIPHPTSLAIRGEIILTKEGFDVLKTKVFTRQGLEYKNARNMVAGLMNSKTNPDIVYSFLKFVSYQIVGVTLSKTAMLYTLMEYGFKVPVLATRMGRDLNDPDLIAYLTERKEKAEYEIDGIVVDVDDELERVRLSPNAAALNPSYSFKYKTTDADNYAETEVTWIELRLSKHGFIKPRFHVKPVNLVGVTIVHATALNAKYLLENKIRPGTKVAISRMGDVVPNVTKILGQTDEMSDDEYNLWFNDQMDQFGVWTWSTTDKGDGVDAKVVDISNHSIILIKQLYDFFDKLDIAFLGMGNVTKLVDSKIDTPESILTMTEAELVGVLGENGKKVFKSIHEKLNGITLHKLVGAHSNQRGIGIRKMRKVELAVGGNFTTNQSISSIKSLDGFDTITATGAMAAINAFNDFFPIVKHLVTLESATPTDAKLAGMKICFTGFRDKPLQAAVESKGGTVQSGVSKTTDLVVTVDVNGASGKLKKARDLSKKIITVEDFMQLL